MDTNIKARAFDDDDHDQKGTNHGFLIAKGQFQTLDFPGINAHADIWVETITMRSLALTLIGRVSPTASSFRTDTLRRSMIPRASPRPQSMHQRPWTNRRIFPCHRWKHDGFVGTK